MVRPAVKILSVAATVALISVGAAFLLMPRLACRDFNASTVTLNNNQFISVALARTPAEHEQGLSGCSSLKLGQGMYFIFPIKTDAIFWMKDMLMPIDIIWLADHQVVGVTPNVPPPANPAASLPTYQAPAPVNGVLEVGAGHAKLLNIKPGTTLKLND